MKFTKKLLIIVVLWILLFPSVAMTSDQCFQQGNDWLSKSISKASGSYWENVINPIISICYYLQAIYLQQQQMIELQKMEINYTRATIYGPSHADEVAKNTPNGLYS